MSRQNWKSEFAKRARKLAFLFLAGISWDASAETPGERFDQFIKKKTVYCEKLDLRKGETTCDILKLKPSDPLATPEGRYAHSIKIPNPVPEDSGYRSGMSSREYFEHLCRVEAGEFVFKTVDKVDGVLQLRPRSHASDNEMQHLYALEDPYGHTNTEADRAENIFVSPIKYRHLDVPISSDGEMTLMKFKRFYGYDGRKLASMKDKEIYGDSSRYGFTWRGITRPHDRELGIAGGELIILDLATSEVFAVRRGYILGGGGKSASGVWWSSGRVCPKYSFRGRRDKDFDFSYWFIGNVLRPHQYEISFKELRNGR